ncbi:MAG: hypothetical protein Q9191_000767 [Dirinaria sp. TL-2023a]
MASAQNHSTSSDVSKLVFPLSKKQPQLINDDVLHQYLEDSTLIDELPLSSEYRENTHLTSLVAAELGTPVLDEIQDYLHFVSPPNFQRIDALHEQRIKKRQILITENPGLHLIWYYDTIFIKPIPPFLLSLTIWREFLLPPISAHTKDEYNEISTCSQRKLYPINSLSLYCKSALGFLRTYALLIRHRSDFLMAQSSSLIPEGITYSEFSAFIKPFYYLPALSVSHRYKFGQMRLTRLNWAVRLLQPRSVSTGSWFANRLYYQELYSQSGDYSVSWLPPLLFAFAALSVVLSAMQVLLAGLGMGSWGSVVQVCLGFSIAAILFCMIACGLLLVYFPILLLGQGVYALRSKTGGTSRTRHIQSKV